MNRMLPLLLILIAGLLLSGCTEQPTASTGIEKVDFALGENDDRRAELQEFLQAKNMDAYCLALEEQPNGDKAVGCYSPEAGPGNVVESGSTGLDGSNVMPDYARMTGREVGRSTVAVVSD